MMDDSLTETLNGFSICTWIKTVYEAPEFTQKNSSLCWLASVCWLYLVEDSVIWL